MCGIAGYVLCGKIAHPRTVEALLDPIRPRGPDDEGVCLVNRDGTRAVYATDRTIPALRADRPHLRAPGAVISHDVALIHTRYSIIDRSSAGHQPFLSRDATIAAIFNGEIYNYLELRRELEGEGVRFRTASDTEVLVEGYRCWGDRIWGRMNGFWAVALYDRQTAMVVLARDRLGVAPLYYRETPAGLFFASSIRALVDIEPSAVAVDTDRLVGFIEAGLKDLDDGTMYRDIRSLPAATIFRLPRTAVSLALARTTRYWQLPAGRLSVRDLSFDEAVERYRSIFFDAVSIRLRADVKVAYELSGGLDSSSIVAVAAQLRSNAVTTYTIKVPEHDEEPYARTILERYPVDYRVLHELEDTFREEEAEFDAVMQEPYHSPNIYTQYQMRRAIKAEGVGVVLSGAGGDEVLAGYESQFWPRAAGELRAAGLGRWVDDYDRGRGTYQSPTLHGTLWGMYWGTRRQAIDVIKMLSDLQGKGGRSALTDRTAQEYQALYPKLAFDQQRRYHLQVAMLPYYLRSNDHFTMAIPMEQRFPFLDYRMVEFGLQLPIQYLFRDGWTKYILRKAMEPHLPAAIVWRRQKMGFPFAYERFLDRHRFDFEPELERLATSGLPVHRFGRYQDLIAKDPMKLWRMCSSALWLAGVGRSGVALGKSIRVPYLSQSFAMR